MKVVQCWNLLNPVVIGSVFRLKMAQKNNMHLISFITV